MALTVPLQFPAGSFVLPDGSTGNLGPGISRRQGSQTGKKVHYLTLDFDGAGTSVESAHVTFRWVTGIAGTLKLLWHANATSNAVKWQAALSAVTPDDADTPLEHAFATAATVTTNVNTTEARRLTESTIDLSGVLDSAADGDLVTLVVFRDANDAADTATVDAELINAALF